jgi:hypothetical protein
MTKNEWYPVCFHNRYEYKKWQYYQKWGDEVVSVCDDCTDEYQQQMKREGRCFMAEAMRKSSNSKKWMNQSHKQ